jgi:glutathione S-transferase
MITIYGVPISVHTRKAIVTAIIKGIDYRCEPVIPFNPPDNWSSLSPTGLIPAMTDGDFTLADSAAICQYIERKYPSSPILPAAARDYARALWFEAYAGGTVFRHVVHGLFFQKIIRPIILKQATDQAVIDTIIADVQPKVFEYLDSEINGEFYVGNRLTLADIAIGSNLINYQYLGFAIDGALYPRLAAFAQRIVEMKPFQLALRDETQFAEGMRLNRSFLPEAVH